LINKRSSIKTLGNSILGTEFIHLKMGGRAIFIRQKKLQTNALLLRTAMRRSRSNAPTLMFNIKRLSKTARYVKELKLL
jgi:hypothetical protein